MAAIAPVTPMVDVSEPEHTPQPEPAPATGRSGRPSLLSICVPTYNRADFLDEFLERLAGFERLDYEVVISDNASEDATAQVVLKWRPYLKSLYYLRQEKTVSPPENVCAVCNAARGDYIFRIADDDLILEDGLLAAKRVLDDDPSCAAVYGSWHICDYNFDKIEYRNDYGPEPARISRAQRLEMYYRYWTVELPMFRRTLFQQHMLAYTKQLPLDFHAAGRFLSRGDLMFIPDLIAKVRSHPGQDSQELYGFRLLQEYLTDYELFLGDVTDLGSQEMVTAFLHKAINVYVVAVRRALSHGKFLEARRMLKKAMAYRVDGVEPLAMEFEKKHLPAVLAEYIFELCRLNPAIRRLVLEQTASAEVYRPLIEAKLARRVAVLPVNHEALLDRTPDEADLVIAQDEATMARCLEKPGVNPARYRCLDDIVDTCSLF
jgi:glycosyltransferase involved in cell wall biosynthesis